MRGTFLWKKTHDAPLFVAGYLQSKERGSKLDVAHGKFNTPAQCLLCSESLTPEVSTSLVKEVIEAAFLRSASFSKLFASMFFFALKNAQVSLLPLFHFVVILFEFQHLQRNFILSTCEIMLQPICL